MPQDGVCRIVLPQNGCEEFGAATAKEAKAALSIELAAAIDLIGDSQEVQSICIVQRDRKAQYRQLPGMQQLRAPLGGGLSVHLRHPL